MAKMSMYKYSLGGMKTAFCCYGNHINMVTLQPIALEEAGQYNHFEWSHDICSSKKKRQNKA